MKKIWSSAVIAELKVRATANQPTAENRADDVITGVGLKQGDRDGSGPEYRIPYYKEDGSRDYIIYKP